MDPEKQSIREEPKKKEQEKYNKLKNEFENKEAQKIYVDKKLNITEVKLNNSDVSETKKDSIVNTNNRIECILEEQQVLEESRALFSEISYLKKKVNDYENSNDRLRAQVYMLKNKISQQ